MKKRTIIIFQILILHSINKRTCPGCLSKSSVFVSSSEVYIYFLYRNCTLFFKGFMFYVSHKHLSLFKKIMFHTGFLIFF